MNPAKPLLRAEDLKMHFPVRGGILKRRVGTVFAVDGVNFEIAPGETLGLVGESGCGKTTVGRTLLQLYKPTSGKVWFKDKDLTELRPHELRGERKNLQMIFQDPMESLNARHTIGKILEEPFVIHGVNAPQERRERVMGLLQKVGLQKSAVDLFPHEFSGGQRQRIGIARAIALNPQLIVCDEPVSALDVSIQSQILNLLVELQKEMKLSYLFIAHDLAVVRHVSDWVAVMYLGKIVEYTPAARIQESPFHPYTRALLSAVPVANTHHRRQRIVLKGDVPSPMAPPSGCRFHPRCPYVQEICRREEPKLLPQASGTTVACHFAGKI